MMRYPTKAKNTWLLLFTILCALVLTIMPVPIWAEWLKPAWLVLVVFYWSVNSPNGISLGAAWILGLILDLLQGTLLGEQALAMTLIAYFAIKLKRRLVFSSLGQQAALLFVLLLVYQLCLLLVQGMLGQFNRSWEFFVPAMSSILFWPLVASLLYKMGIRPAYRTSRM